VRWAFVFLLSAESIVDACLRLDSERPFGLLVASFCLR